ncbi:MAG TPA: hypothetical protein VFU49_10455 [Ktedonobacteraceae bacterium]|nr:hypothetical protein [Ktedonobacteraceae bacterium]
MRTRERSNTIPSIGISDPAPTAAHQGRLAWLRSPLWLCLLLALGLRIWLLMRTQGFIDGDEAVVGIQAQHILRGEFPVYYYGQPYMGSLEAYFIALLFALIGSSTWAMRVEPILLSLVLVWLTWRLAGALADAAKLPAAARRWFMTIAALFATLPPLYDAVMEMRTWGGHIEIYIVMLLLLLSALRLTQRWQDGATHRELALRWAGLGFLIGLGLWIYPLVISAILTAILWIAGYCVFEFFKARRTSGEQQGSTASLLQRLALAVAAIPASLVGFAPALFWGATHQWANITYLLSPGNNDSHNIQLQTLYPNRLSLLFGTIKLYTQCIAPHVIGGALPDTRLSFSLLQASIGILFVLATLSLVTFSLFRHHPALVRIQQLATLPTIFAVTTAVIFCGSSIAAAGLLVPCTRDEVGRYAAPLLLVLPFFFATILTAIYLYKGERNQQEAQNAGETNNVRQRPLFNPIQAALIAFLVLYLGAHSYTYLRARADYTFQSFACSAAPLHNEPIITYMQQQHISYAWATMWIGNAIVFKTAGTILVADPRIITVGATNHIPAYTSAVSHADRPAILAFALHTDTHPDLLKALDTMGVTYQLARFPAEQGLDVLVVTPDRTLSPFDANSLGAWFYGC